MANNNGGDMGLVKTGFTWLSVHSGKKASLCHLIHSGLFTRIWPTLVQMLACLLCRANPPSQPMMTYCQLDNFIYKFGETCNKLLKFSFRRTASENNIRKMNKAGIGLDNGLSPGGAKPPMMTDDYHSIGQFGKKNPATHASDCYNLHLEEWHLKSHLQVWAIMLCINVLIR